MVKFRQLLITISIAATLVASGAFAQTNLTQILDTITNPDGTSFNGTVVITWNGYSGSGSGTVSRLSTTARVYNGALSVLLVPTTTASPGTYYQVVYTSSNGTASWTETWQVPPSTTALTLAAVRQTSTEGTGGGGTLSGGGSGSTQYATLPIAISQVTNLASSLSTTNSTLGTVQTAATALGTTVTGLNTTVTGLNTSVTNQGVTLTSLSTTVAGLNTAVTGQGTTVTNLNNTVTGLNSTVTNHAASISSLNTTVGSLSSTQATQGTTLTGLSNSIGTLNTTVSGQGTSLTTLTTNLNNLTTTVSGNSSSLTSVNTTVGGLSNNVTSLTNTLNGLSATVNSLSSVGSLAVFVDAETPNGTINGTNSAFSLANTPAPTSSLSLFRNGLELSQGVDYTLAGSAITFKTAALPQTGDLLTAFYRMTGSGAATNFTDNETPGGVVNGTNLTFTLASAPNPVNSLRLYRNGVLLASGAEYTVSGSSITFTTARVPQSGDVLVTYYRH
jgi:uncharacterized coiled-coil protein SlyX